MGNRKPSFRDVRRQHCITLGMLYEDVLSADKNIQIHYSSVELFDIIGIGKQEVVDAILASLSRLTGKIYNRENIGRIALLPVLDDD